MKKYYYSNQGCIKIGNNEYTSLYLNGKGEGSFWIRLVEKKEKVDKNGYKYIAYVSGKNINVYECENTSNIVFRLENGNYAIFSKKGDILIEKS